MSQNDRRPPPAQSQQQKPPAAAQQKPPSRISIVRSLVNRQMLPYAAKLLSKSVDAERFARVFLNAIENGPPALVECTDGSLARAMLLSAEVNLMPGGTYPFAYLIPYFNKEKKAYEAQFQISVWGYTELMRRAGVQKVWADVIYEADEYDCISGSAGKQIIHKPKWFLPRAERGRMLGSYACALLANGETVFEPVSAEDLELARKQNSGRSPAWEIWPDQQYQKVAIKRLSKYAPKGDPKDARALEIDENPNTAPVIDVPGLDVSEGTTSSPATTQDALGAVVSQARAASVAQNEQRPGLDREQLYSMLCDADERWKGLRKRFEAIDDREALEAASWLHAVERLRGDEIPPEMPPCIQIEEQHSTQDAVEMAFGGKR